MPDSLLRISAAFLILAVLGVAFYLLLAYIGRRTRGRLKKIFTNTLFLILASPILAVAIALGICNFYVYHGFGHQPDIFRRGDRNGNMVAITFDDGPSPLYTPTILDILDQYEVKATFFLVGCHVEKYPEIARRIADAGHELGNHTQNHRNLPTLGHTALKNEIVGATACIWRQTGQVPSFMRPPRGMYDGRLRRLAALMGQRIVLWSVSGRDWRRGVSAGEIVRKVVPKARGGEIILFHDSGALVRSEGGDRSATIRALPRVIEGLRAKGLRIVLLSVLLYGGETGEEFPRVEEAE